jgi:hypothetical protein
VASSRFDGIQKNADTKKNRRGFQRFFGSSMRFVQVRSDLSTAGGLENQK